MATIIPLALEVKARVDSFNKDIQSVVQSVNDLSDMVANAADNMVVFEDTIKKSAIAIATDFVQNIRIAIDQVENFAVQIDLTVQRLLRLTASGLNFTATFFPALSSVSITLRMVASSLGFLIRTGLMLLGLTALTMWFRGLTFHAAMASVAAAMFTQNITLLISRIMFLSSIPMLAAMAVTVEAMNRKVAQLNGTLTPLQHGLAAVKEAWEKWSVLMSNGVMDYVGAFLRAIGSFLSMIADYIKIANDYYETNFVLIARVTKALVSMFLVLTAIRAAYIMFRGNVIIMAMIEAITRLVGLLRVVAGWTGINIALTVFWTRAQAILNATAMAHPFAIIFIILLAVVGLIYGMIRAFQYFRRSSAEAEDAAKRLKERVEMLTEVTKRYKNSLRETVEEHKEILNMMLRIQEASRTPVQKAADNANKLQNAINEPQRLQQDIDRLNAEIETRKKLIANITDKEQIKALKERNEEAVKTLDELRDIQAKVKPLTQQQIAYQQAENRKEFAKDSGLNIADKLSNYDVLMKQLDTIKEIIARNDQVNEMTVKETQNAIDNAVANFRQAEGVNNLIKPFKDANAIFDQTNSNLKLWLDKGIINAQEYADGLKNAAGHLADDLGITGFLKDSAKTLQQAYNDIAIYAQKIGMSMKEEAAARDRAKAAFEKQSEYYNLYQKAKDALTPMADRIKEVNKKIDKEAAMFGWSKEVTDKMKALAEAEMNQVKESKRENQILTKGSTAYTDYQNKNLQNDHLKSIRDNSKKQTDLLAKNTDAINKGFSNLEKCFEVIG